MARSFLLAFLAFSFFSIDSKAQLAGSLDATFGDAGKAKLLPQPTLNKNYGLALQPDGKILLAGWSLAGATDAVELARLLPDGSADASFGAGGFVEKKVGAGDAFGYAVALQTDGKIIVAGGAKVVSAAAQGFLVMRFLANGAVDSTFSGDGIQIFSMVNADGAARSVAIQPDGKIVVAGTAFTTNDSKMGLARLKTDGNLDPTFSGDGKTTLAIGNFFTEAYALGIQNGKITVAGSAKFGMEDDAAVARFLADGSLDVAFGAAGQAVVNLGSAADAANALVLQPDGKILVAGTTGATRDFALFRLLEKGSLDMDFAAQGVATVDFLTLDDVANSMVLQPDGKILLGGYAYVGPKPDFAVARFLADGSIDGGFGEMGLATADFGDGYDFGFPMAMQPDGKIVLGGFSFSGGATAFAAARFISGLSVGAIDFENAKMRLVVAPNPISDRAFLEFELAAGGLFSLELFDSKGRLEQTFFTKKSMSVGPQTEAIFFEKGLPRGWHFLRLNDGRSTFSIKIILK